MVRQLSRGLDASGWRTIFNHISQTKKDKIFTDLLRKQLKNYVK